MRFRSALAFVLSGLLMFQSAIGSISGGCLHSAHANSAAPGTALHAHHVHHHGALQKAEGKGCGCGCNCSGTCLHACHFAAIAPMLSAISVPPQAFVLVLLAGVKLASHSLPLLRPPAVSL